MSTFNKYRRLPEITEMRPYQPGETLDPSVSLSESDAQNGHPMEGGMIARDPHDPSDKWYIRPGYFERNFEQEPIGACESQSSSVDVDNKYYKEYPR